MKIFKGSCDEEDMKHLRRKFVITYERNFIYFFRSLDGENRVLFLKYLFECFSTVHKICVRGVLELFIQIQYSIEEVLDQEEIERCNGNIFSYFTNLEMKCRLLFFKMYFVPYKVIVQIGDDDMPCSIHPH